MTPFRVLVAVGLAAILAGTSYALRPLDVEAVEPSPPRQESTADLVQASVRGCVEGLGLATIGIEDGVVVVRCRPNLGVVEVRR